MKPKKKPSTDTKKSMKKPLPVKPIMLIDKTIATTKQKTHTTIQDHHEIGEAKKSARGHKNTTNRKGLSRKMELHDLSSFSGSERSSLSPKYQRKKSPIDKQPKEKKKNKSKPTLAIEKQLEKRKKQVNSRQTKMRQSWAKQQAHQSQYENMFMRRLDEKKITQMSEQSQVSVPKISKLQINIPQYVHQSSTIKSNHTVIRELKHKIHEKYRKSYPGLHKKQLDFFCFVVLIQRMWKQYKIKKFISNFFTPRASLIPVASGDSHREHNNSKLDSSLTTQEQTLEIIRKYIHDNPLSERKMIMERELHSTQMQTTKKKEQKSSLDQLEISTELTPQRQAKLIKFVQCLRDISFHKAKPQEARSKIDVFNLQSSLSQKCLMQKFYNKVFKDSSIKRNNFDIFSIKRQEKLLQHSIQLINILKPAEKIENIEIIQVSQRFETEPHQDISKYEIKVQRVEVSVETDEVLEPKEINTLKQLNTVAQGVIQLLLSELYSDAAFQRIQKSQAKKKRRGHMPGLYITKAKIKQYLLGLSSYMLDNYGNEVIRRFRTVNPLSILKIHHQYDDQEDYYEDQQSEFDLPIIPNTLFYEYQVIYEEQNFVVPEEARKFINFLQGLIKIHNLLLRDCLAENLEKNKIDRCVLPWDQNAFPHRSNLKRTFGRHEVQQDLNKTIQKICNFAFLRVGQFHRSFDDPLNIRRLNKLWLEDQDEANDWNSRYEYLELRIDIAKNVQRELFQELIKEILIFF